MKRNENAPARAHTEQPINGFFSGSCMACTVAISVNPFGIQAAAPPTISVVFIQVEKERVLEHKMRKCTSPSKSHLSIIFKCCNSCPVQSVIAIIYSKSFGSNLRNSPKKGSQLFLMKCLPACIFRLKRKKTNRTTGNAFENGKKKSLPWRRNKQSNSLWDFNAQRAVFSTEKYKFHHVCGAVRITKRNNQR